MPTAATGRRNGEQRRSAMLQAAASVFFEQGYAATSIDSVIERLGGSKRNIYKEFGSKEGLFTALVSECADEAMAALDADDLHQLHLRQAMIEFGRRLMTIYTSPTLLGVYRTVIMEAQRFPDLARAFYDKGPGRAAARLKSVLEQAKASGEVEIGDCAAAADHFMGMVRDNFHLRIVLGLQPMPTPKQIDKLVVSAVDIFLNGVRAKRAPLPPGSAKRAPLPAPKGSHKKS